MTRTTLTVAALERYVHRGGSDARITDSSFTKAELFTARTTKRFPSPRCASAMQIVRPLESTAETQPQLQPDFFRLSAIPIPPRGR
jgi:hypothetical protein